MSSPARPMKVPRHRRRLLLALVMIVTAGVGTALALTPSVPWATRAGGTGSDKGSGVSALPDGSAIVIGYFNGNATFGSTTLTSFGDDDVFTAKVNPDGTYAWAIRRGGSGQDRGGGVSALPDGSAFVIWNGFIAKVNADGTFAWEIGSGGFSGGVSALPDGSAIVTGYFVGTATFGSTTLTSSASYDVFTVKVNSDRTYAWATGSGGAGLEIGRGVSALPDGSAIITGHFRDTARFGSTAPLASSGGDDVFVARLNADGTYAWAIKGGGTGRDEGTGVSALPDGSAIVTGWFNGTAAFGSTTLMSSGGYEVFIAKVNADGTYAWARRAGGG